MTDDLNKRFHWWRYVWPDYDDPHDRILRAPAIHRACGALPGDWRFTGHCANCGAAMGDGSHFVNRIPLPWESRMDGERHLLDFYRKRAFDLANNVSRYSQESYGCDPETREAAAEMERRFRQIAEVGVKIPETTGAPY